MNNYKVMKFFVWKKRLSIVERFFSELMWIWDVDIVYEGSCVVVSGMKEDVLCVVCLIERLLMERRGEL